MYACEVITLKQSTNQPGELANPVNGQLNREKFPCSRWRLRIWFRETDLAVPSRVSLSFFTFRLNLVLTHGIAPDVHGGVHIFLPPHTIGSVQGLSGHAIVYR